MSPARLTARDTVANILSVIFIGGLGFFAYRLYMENRTTRRPCRQRRLVLYASATMLAFALIGTRVFWDSAARRSCSGSRSSGRPPTASPARDPRLARVLSRRALFAVARVNRHACVDR